MLLFELGLLLLKVCICLAEKEFLEDYPFENPDLFEGDIIGFESSDERNAIVNEKRIWTNGIVPYVLDPGLSSVISLSLISKAMRNYENKTCIRFVQRTSETNYIRIFPGKGCYSHVGTTGGIQPLSLGKGCGFHGTVTHELGHAIGFYHEHSRSDRDDFITILWGNIKEGQESQFKKIKPEKNRLLTPFDYDSIMLYGSYTFSKDKSKLLTMVGPNNMILKGVTKKKFVSKSDVLRIKKLYHCKE